MHYLYAHDVKRPGRPEDMHILEDTADLARGTRALCGQRANWDYELRQAVPQYDHTKICRLCATIYAHDTAHSHKED